LPKPSKSDNVYVEMKEEDKILEKQILHHETCVLTQIGMDKIDEILGILLNEKEDKLTANIFLAFHAVREDIKLSSNTIETILKRTSAVEEIAIKRLFKLLFKLLKDNKNNLKTITSNEFGRDVDWGFKRNIKPQKRQTVDNENELSFDITTSQYIQNLPSRQYSKFFGRENEIKKLLKYLSPEHGQAITVVDGIGGVGKTSLVLEAVYRCLCQQQGKRKNNNKCKSFPKFDVIIFASAKQEILLHPTGERLESSRTLVEIINKIGEVLDTSILHGTRAEQIRKIHAHLRKKRTLIIIDNFETVTDRGTVLSFLTDLPLGTKSIITTREQVTLLSLIRISHFPRPEGLRFINYEASEKQQNLLEKESEEIYEATGGVPLAIVYAIGRLRGGLPLSSVIEDLKNPNSNIAHYCFKKSVNDLKKTIAYKLLMAISIFRSSASSDAVFDVSGCNHLSITLLHQEIERLINFSLISFGKHDLQGRLQILPLTREYVLTELRANGDFKQEALDRWIKWYLELAKKSSEGERQEYQMHYETIDKEWANFLSVLRHCKDEHRYHDVRDLWFYLNNYANLRGKWEDRLSWLQFLVEESALRGETATNIKAKIKRARILLLMASETDLAEAKKILLEVWSLRNCDAMSFANRDYILNHLAGLYIRLNNYEEAHRWLDIEQEQLNNEQEIEDKDRISHQIYIDRERSDVFLHQQNFHKSKLLAEKVIEFSKKVGKRRSINYARRILAEITIYRDHDFRNAEELLVLGFGEVYSLKDKRMMAYYYGSFAILERAKNNFSKARSYAELAEREFDRLGMVRNSDRIKSFLKSLSTENRDSTANNSDQY